jgi:hypothetical protein
MSLRIRQQNPDTGSPHLMFSTSLNPNGTRKFPEYPQGTCVPPDGAPATNNSAASPSLCRNEFGRFRHLSLRLTSKSSVQSLCKKIRPRRLAFPAQSKASKTGCVHTFRASKGLDFSVLCRRSTPHVGLHRSRLGVPQRLPAGITILFCRGGAL